MLSLRICYGDVRGQRMFDAPLLPVICSAQPGAAICSNKAECSWRSLLLQRMQVDKAEQDKQSAIIRAQGEAQSAKLIGEAIQKNPAFLMLRKIEVRTHPLL